MLLIAILVAIIDFCFEFWIENGNIKKVVWPLILKAIGVGSFVYTIIFILYSLIVVGVYYNEGNLALLKTKIERETNYNIKTELIADYNKRLTFMNISSKRPMIIRFSLYSVDTNKFKIIKRRNNYDK